MNVQELFPEFRDGEVLRFSRLFPIKDSHKPKIWKHMKKKKTKTAPKQEKKEDSKEQAMEVQPVEEKGMNLSR